MQYEGKTQMLLKKNKQKIPSKVQTNHHIFDPNNNHYIGLKLCFAHILLE